MSLTQCVLADLVVHPGDDVRPLARRHRHRHLIADVGLLDQLDRDIVLGSVLAKQPLNLVEVVAAPTVPQHNFRAAASHRRDLWSWLGGAAGAAVASAAGAAVASAAGAAVASAAGAAVASAAGAAVACSAAGAVVAAPPVVPPPQAASRSASRARTPKDLSIRCIPVRSFAEESGTKTRFSGALQFWEKRGFEGAAPSVSPHPHCKVEWRLPKPCLTENTGRCQTWMDRVWRAHALYVIILEATPFLEALHRG